MTKTFPGQVRTRNPAEREPDLTSIVVIHRAMRSDLGRLTDVLGAARARDVAAARAIGRYAAALFTEIRHHHHSEDAIVWPIIAAAAGACVDLTPLSDDHEALDGMLDRAARALADLGDAPPVHISDLHACALDLRDLLDEHIAEEEEQILPVMRRYVPAGAYAWCEKQIQHEATPARLVFAVPWLARFAEPGELRRLLAAGGWPARFVLAAARPRYRRLERRAFGGLASRA